MPAGLRAYVSNSPPSEFFLCIGRARRLKRNEFILMTTKKSQNVKKGITIDQLARMVSRGFEGVTKEFAATNKKMTDEFAQINERLDTIERNHAVPRP